MPPTDCIADALEYAALHARLAVLEAQFPTTPPRASKRGREDDGGQAFDASHPTSPVIIMEHAAGAAQALSSDTQRKEHRHMRQYGTRCRLREAPLRSGAARWHR